MTKRFLAVAVLAILFVSIASAQDAKTVIANATKAMGYENLNTIQFSGPVSKEGLGLGQWISATKGWHHNTVRDYVRFIDLGTGTAQRNGAVKREGDMATGLLPGGAGLDPNFTNPPVPGTTRVEANANFAGKLDITLSPPGFLKLAAAAPNATVRNQGGRRLVTFDYPGVMAPSGAAYKVTGTINNQNMLEKVETAYEDTGASFYIFGDIAVEQVFSDYKDYGGVKFPSKITQNRAGVLYNEFTVADVKANGTVPAAIAPAAGGGGGRGAGGAGGQGGRGGGAPPAGGGGQGGRGGGAAAPPGPQKLADGVFAIGGGYKALAIDMKDGIVIVDAPTSGNMDVVALAKEAIPNKPISHLITSHMHFDHVEGMRSVLADGLKEVTLVTSDMNKDVVEKWFSNPRILQATTPAAGAAAAAPPPAAPAAGGQGGRGGGGGAALPWPDALAKSGKKVKFQYVKDKWTLKDDNHTIDVYPIKGALHSEDMVVVHLPKEKIIYQADAYNPGAVGAVTTGVGQLAFQKLLAAELDRLKIDYETVVAGHTRVATKQDLMVAIGRVPPPTPPAGAPAAAPAAGGRGGQ